MRRSAVLPFAALLALAAPAFAEPLTLLPTGHWVAPVRVNGQGPFEFVVDTAASISAVFPALRARLALAGVDNDGGRVHGASGAQSFRLFPLESLAIDGRTARNLVTVGLNHIPEDGRSGGIVGADVLSHFVAEFDMPGGRLNLHDPGTDLPGSWREVPFTLSRARFAILDGMLDGRPVTMVVDTGARRTIVNWAAAEAAGVARDSPDLVPGEPIGGATDHRTPAVYRDFRSLGAGPLSLSATRVHIADLAVFRLLGLEGRPAMILGIDRLAALRFAIDYPRRRLLFQPPPATATR